MDEKSNHLELPRGQSRLKVGRNALLVNPALSSVYSVKTLFHSSLSVVSFNGIKYLLGVQIAEVLKRKTFNLYHCMKKKNINLRRATQNEVEYLISLEAVLVGTHSVTLVPYAEGLCFVADAFYRYVRFPNEDPSSFVLKKRRSYSFLKHKIHRRKPLPWDIQRAVKKSTTTAAPSSTSRRSQLEGTNSVFSLHHTSTETTPNFSISSKQSFALTKEISPSYFIPSTSEMTFLTTRRRPEFTSNVNPNETSYNRDDFNERISSFFQFLCDF